jgi:hypothetical protein
MIVYIESNFVLEQALEQEQCESCEALIRIAGDRAIRILIPAFSLAEPHIALMHKGNERSRFVSFRQGCVSQGGIWRWVKQSRCASLHEPV